MPILPEICRPDSDALLVALSGIVDDGDLQIIANADYGNDAPKHFAVLHRIAREGHIPRPLLWEPGEVLELTRWSEPDPAWSQEDIAAEHRRRAFACAALLRSYGEQENTHHCWGENQTLAQLVASLHALDIDLSTQTAAFLAWLTPLLPAQNPEEYPYFGLALLWAALALPSVPDQALSDLIDWIILTEDEAASRWRQRYSDYLGSDWLLHLTLFNSRQDVWRIFGTWLVERLAPRHGSLVDEGVRMIAALLKP